NFQPSGRGLADCGGIEATRRRREPGSRAKLFCATLNQALPVARLVRGGICETSLARPSLLLRAGLHCPRRNCRLAHATNEKFDAETAPRPATAVNWAIFFATDLVP